MGLRFAKSGSYPTGKRPSMSQKRLDLLVVHPCSGNGVYGDLSEDLVAVEPPVWTRIIAGYVKDKGYNVRIIDAEAMRHGPQQVAIAAVEANPRLVCIAAYGHQPSASTQMMTGAGAVARAIKDANRDMSIIMVGGHVSALPQQTMAEEAIDYACVGEGPATIVGLLGRDNLNRDIPGLVWRSANSEVRINPSAPLLDIDELHGDVWDLLPMHRYRAHNWQRFGQMAQPGKYASVHTSLGCPYRCSFCCINAPFGSNQYRMRDPGKIVAEIANLYFDYGVTTLKIVDEMFVLNERHYTAICKGLADRGIGDRLNIWAYARVDTVKPETLGILRAGGVRWLALGIESADPKVRDGASKQMRKRDIAEVVRQIQAAGINVIGNYIFGLPDDDRESMEATLDLALELNTEFANFYSAMAYPGSKLYADAVRDKAMLPKSWSGYSQHSTDCTPLDTKYLSSAEVLRFRDAAFQTYFRSPEYLDMVECKFGRETREHVETMADRKLPRDGQVRAQAEAAE